MPAQSDVFRPAKIALTLAALLILGTAFIARGDSAGIRLETRLVGQKEWLVGGQVSVRVLAMEHVSQSPVSGAVVDMTMTKDGAPKPIKLAHGVTNSRGTFDAAVWTPNREGDYKLNVVVRGLGETDTLTSPVSVKRAYRVLLTTDKPLYQPGQMIHMRALALAVPSLKPVTARKLTLEVEDPKGNKVFKKISDLSRFGLAGADFQLASEINQGAYKIRALVEDERSEKTVRVERYVLPKFKVTLDTDRKYYLPGETVRGTVHADYFFGKPVDGGKVVVKLAKFDVGFNDFGEINGVTNDSGVFEFEQKLPAFFAGQPLEQGDAFFKAEVSVTDGADHTEKITSMVPVAKSPLKLVVIPEAGRLVPKVRNVIYVVVSYPDGTPAKASVVMNNGKPVRTNQYGLAEFEITPKDASTNLTVSAVDDKGRGATITASFEVAQGEESLLLRVDKAIATVGDELGVSVLSSARSGYVYLDIVKEGQTMLTSSLSFNKGEGRAVVPLGPDLFGSLKVHAYRISRSGNIIRDTRTLYVNPANDLRIAVSADKKTHLPGEEARISFDVKDRRGKGLAAALGVSIVDESVFALQEMQPGLEKIYFMLEKELAEPKFEIHGVTPKDIVEGPRPLPRPLGLEKQEAAKALFAAAQKEQLSSEKQPFTLQANSFQAKMVKAREQLSVRMKDDLRRIAAAIREFYGGNPKNNLSQLGGVHYLAREGLLDGAALKDQWGKEYEFADAKWNDYRYEMTVRSWGMDKRSNTLDDIILYVSPADSTKGGLDVNKDIAFAFSEEFVRGRGRWIARLGDGMREGDFPVFAARPMDAAAGAIERAEVGGKVDFFFGDNAVKSNEMRDVAQPAPEVRVRQYFPETLYFNPSVITDENGKASIGLTMADSITTWRLTAMASSLGGLLGSTTAPLRVFQDFFIDIDLPVALTQNDEVSIPIAVYNYLPGSQKVRLVLDTEPWFELDGVAEKTLNIGSGDVRAVYYRIKVKQIGWHKLTVRAYGSKMNDAISRQIEVLPDGREVRESVNDRLEKNVKRTINIPAGAIDGASNIVVKVYPGFFSQLLEGMDKILQMPFGCFEQTSSTTYPNILALQYMKDTNQSTPEIQMKAEQYINLGYQRLLTFEVPGGGFSWFGDAPANKILTAWGLMEFADMSRVYEVDPNLISRTQKWLASKQEADGSWKPDANYLHEESWGRIQHNEILPTAYITWALVESGYGGPETRKGLDYLEKNWKQADDAYTLAIICNAFFSTMPKAGAHGEMDWKHPTAYEHALDKLVGMAKEEDGKVHWESGMSTVTFTHGKGADLEATALATLALIKSGRHADTVGKALAYIVSAKDPNGTWYSTQATILCLKALIASMNNRTQDVDAKVTVIINGKKAGEFHIDKETSDVLRQVDGKEYVKPGENTVEIQFEGRGSTLYQIDSRYYLPWETRPANEKRIMSITVDYDRTQLEKDEVVKAQVKVAFNGRGSANMVIVDLGLPPGFDVLPEDLEKLVETKVIQKYSLTNRQIIVYLDKVESGKPVEFSYSLRAKFPLRARTPRSVVYQYYNPEVRDVAPPVEMVVK
ncbi:MAG: alpha-2-macroglobulin family protein [Armatimonadota bacterium]|nr:alpha-2-macroglobulin family protein [Armatimonadota bacterium]